MPLTITGGSGVLSLTGTNTGFIGQVRHASGTLLFSATRNLFGRMNRYNFEGNTTTTENADTITAISAYASNPTSATESAMNDAIAAARTAGTLPTFAVAAGSSITIDGNGGDSHRLDIPTNKAGSFHLEDGATLTFKGTAYSSGGDAYGGAVAVGNGSLLALTAGDGAGYIFSGNSATGGNGSYANGGAIYNNGTLTLTNSDFTGNYATVPMGYVNGGAIYNAGTLALTNADFTGNYASGNAWVNGGAIYNSDTLTVNNADFTGNYALSGGAASGGAIYNQGTLTLNVTTNERAVFTGNVEVGGGSALANSIYLSSGSSLAVNTDAGAVLDMRDPMRGDSYATTIAITKSGAGTWKLGGANEFASIGGGNTTFAVNAGTLYLYRAGEVDNANATYTPNATVDAGSISLAGLGSSFTLADGAVLAVGGVGHNITSGGTIAIAGDLAFDMTGATTATTSLTLTAPTIDTTVVGAKIGSGAITVSNFTVPTTVGEEYILVEATANTTANTGSLFLNGSAVAHQVNRSSLEYGLAVDTTSSRLLIKSIDASGPASLTWTGAVNGNWNADDRNWSGQIDGVRVDRFLNGDSVTFAANASPENIAVASGGVGVGTMTVNGDYNFSGGTIAASGAVTVAAGKTLGLHIAGTDPALTAGSIDFNTTGVLKITGYSPAADVNPFENPLKVSTAIRTTTGVSNFNSAVRVEGQTADNAFLTARAYVDGDEVKVETGLRWYSTDPARPAHGNFDIAADKTFTLGAVLADTSGSSGWGGKSLIKEGDGTLVLTAANTYTGTTIATAGTLRLANQNAVAQSSGVTVDDGATLAVDQSSNVKSLFLADSSTIAIATGSTITSSGPITLGGNLTVDLSSLTAGSHDLLVSTGSTITGFNENNITTLIDGRSLSNRANAVYSHVTSTSDIVKLDLSINNLAVAWQGGSGNWSDANWAGSDDKVFYGGDSVAFASGSGTVTVAAGGVQVADMTVSGGTYTFTGGSIRSTTTTTLAGTTQRLTVSGGSATFENDITFAGGISVGNGGTLYGSASIASGTGGVSVASGGTFGATAGKTLTVDTLTMDAGSTFAVADANSRVNVIGTTSVADGVGFSFGSGFVAGTTYTILSSTSAIAGWSGPFETTSAFLRYTVDAANNGQDLAVLVEEYRTLLSLGLTPNQAAVVSGLESWNGGSNELIAAVKALGSEAEALAALDALTGQIHRNLPSAMIRSNRGFWRLLNGPALSLRDDAVAAAAGSGNAFASIDPRACYRPRPLLWFSGGALYSRSRSDTDTARDRLNGTEFMVGGEAPLAGWNLGLAFRYADTRMKVDARSSRADLDNYQLGLYATRAIRLGSGHLRLTLGAGGGYHDIESRRDVAFAGVGQHLRSGYDAWSFSGLAEAGYRLDASPCLAVEPFVSLGWDGVWNNSFAESGGSAALRGGSDRQSNLSTTLGTRLSYRLTERVSVDANAGWRHTYGNVQPRSGLAFAASPTRNSFTIVGSKLARDEFVGGLGVRVDLADRVFLRADYEIEAGSGGQSHQGTLSVGVGF